MSMPTRVAAVATAVALAASPTAAFAAKPHHTSAAKTCAALKAKMGTKAFDAKFGKGSKHTAAMARCVAQHKTKTKSKRS
jgi:hypothetical protein